MPKSGGRLHSGLWVDACVWPADPNSLPNSSWPLLRSHNRAFAAMNDSAGVTFEETADIIKATLLRPILMPKPFTPNGTQSDRVMADCSKP